MTAIAPSAADRRFLDLVEDVLQLNSDITVADIEALMLAAKATDRVGVYEQLLVGEQRPAMVRAIEAGINYSRRSEAHQGAADG
ncbi:hypothetical protein [Streptacidiphilus sp. EB103A]|uniref:hypothetical protein n=1 Tax=Streptacidiphilus sp. EB103A TaxID=3156275 RepID=UPI0035180BD0